MKQMVSIGFMPVIDGIDYPKHTQDTIGDVKELLAGNALCSWDYLAQYTDERVEFVEVFKEAK
jgi:hypothetical protein